MFLEQQLSILEILLYPHINKLYFKVYSNRTVFKQLLGIAVMYRIITAFTVFLIK